MQLQPQDLKMRERLALVLIVRHVDDRVNNPLQNAPQHSLLKELINEALPPRYSRGKIMPVVTSKQQTYEDANKLRMAGLLIDAPGMQFNMKPTPAGRALARRWARQVEAYTKQEWMQWQEQGRREATRKSRAHLQRLAA